MVPMHPNLALPSLGVKPGLQTHFFSLHSLFGPLQLSHSAINQDKNSSLTL